MLALERQEQQGISIGPDVRIWVSRIRTQGRPRVWLGIDAPKSMYIGRYEEPPSPLLRVGGQVPAVAKGDVQGDIEQVYRRQLSQLRTLLRHMREKTARGEAVTASESQWYHRLRTDLEREAGL